MSEASMPRDRKKLAPRALGNSKSAELSDDSGATRSRHLLTAMLAFRDGDFSARLPADWPGTDGRVAEAFSALPTRRAFHGKSRD
jgi:hypothetical protein